MRMIRRVQWISVLVGMMCVIVGYALGNLLPWVTTPTSAPASTPRLGYISNSFAHVLDLTTGTDVNVGTPNVEGNRYSPSPDGRLMANWTMLDNALWRLDILDLTTGQREEIGEFEIAFPTLSWSPDSKKILFAAFENGDSYNHELYFIDIETRETQQLTNNTFDDAQADLSPDGQRIVYKSNADGYNRLYIMQLDFGEIRLLSDQTFGYVPAWSPDGRQIAFMSNHEDRHGEIYVIDADGQNLRQVTFNDATDENPFWIP